MVELDETVTRQNTTITDLIDIVKDLETKVIKSGSLESRLTILESLQVDNMSNPSHLTLTQLVSPKNPYNQSTLPNTTTVPRIAIPNDRKPGPGDMITLRHHNHCHRAIVLFTPRTMCLILNHINAQQHNTVRNHHKTLEGHHHPMPQVVKPPKTPTTRLSILPLNIDTQTSNYKTTSSHMFNNIAMVPITVDVTYLTFISGLSPHTQTTNTRSNTSTTQTPHAIFIIGRLITKSLMNIPIQPQDFIHGLRIILAKIITTIT